MKQLIDTLINLGEEDYQYYLELLVTPEPLPEDFGDLEALSAGEERNEFKLEKNN